MDRFSLTGSSIHVPGLLCHQCQAGAVGLCMHCEAFLCAACFKYVSQKAIDTSRKTHLSDSTMQQPQQQKTHRHDSLPPRNTKHECTSTITGSQADIECTELFCMHHAMNGCKECSLHRRKHCKTYYAPDTAGDVNGVTEYNAVVKHIQDLLKEVHSREQDIETISKEAETSYTNARTEIRMFRRELDAYLDKKEQDIMSECDTIKRENESRTKELRVKYTTIKYKLDQFHIQLSTHSKQSPDVLMLTKETGISLKHIEQDMTLINDSNILQKCIFRKNEFINDIVQTSYFGKVATPNINKLQAVNKQHISQLRPKYSGEIDIESLPRYQSCQITGIVAVSKGVIACVDTGDNSVKIIDVKRHMITSSASFTSHPWDIASINAGQLAVTIPAEKTIQFICSVDGLGKGHTIDVKGECRGLAYSNGKFVVSFTKPPKVSILSVNGKVLRNIKKDWTGVPLFKWPLYVSVSSEGDCIYVSDNNYCLVIKLSFTGTVLARYSNKDLLFPRGLAVCEDGSVLVCSSGSDSVHHISSQCRNMRILLTEQDGINNPQSLCLDDGSQTLIVNHSDYLKEKFRIYDLQ